MRLFGNKASSHAGAHVQLSAQGEERNTQARRFPWGRGKVAALSSERAFSANSCVIWNDIRRALDGAGK